VNAITCLTGFLFPKGIHRDSRSLAVDAGRLLAYDLGVRLPRCDHADEVCRERAQQVRALLADTHRTRGLWRPAGHGGRAGDNGRLAHIGSEHFNGQ